MSFGSPTKEEKFYKGAKNDTVWNKDLLWQKHVSKEIKQSKINTGELRPDPALKMRYPRMKMGITGTLIPDVTPRYNEEPCEPRALTSSSSRRRLVSASAGDGEDTRSIVSRARSVRSMSSSASHHTLRSSGSSVLSSSSSRHSLRLEDVQQIVDNQSRQLKETTEEEMRALRDALQSEARKREAAGMRLSMLCEKLGMDEAK